MDPSINKSSRFIKVLTECFVFVAVWGAFVTKSYSNERYYAVAIAYVFIMIIVGALAKESFYIDYSSNLIIPFLMVSTWLYGALIGALNGNDPAYIVRNFAGLTLYALAFFIYGAHINYSSINKLLLFCANVLMILTPITYYLWFVISQKELVQKIPFLSSFSAGIQGSGFSLEYFGSILMFVGYCYCLYRILTTKTVFSWQTIVAAFYAFDLIIISKSGGVALALFAVSAFVFLALLNKDNTRGNAFIKLVILGLVSVAFFLVGIKYLGSIFSHDDGGNTIRYRQINYILNNLSFFGHGLGAEYTAIGQSYAIEAIYLDLLYKLGVVAIVPLAIYVYSFVKAFVHLLNTKGNWQDVVPLALLGNLFISLGNPTLFSAGAVIEHILILGFMNQSQRGDGQ